MVDDDGDLCPYVSGCRRQSSVGYLSLLGVGRSCPKGMRRQHHDNVAEMLKVSVTALLEDEQGTVLRCAVLF